MGYPDVLVDYNLTKKDLHAERIIKFKEKNYIQRIKVPGGGGYWVMYTEKKVDIRHGEGDARRHVVLT